MYLYLFNWFPETCFRIINIDYLHNEIYLLVVFLHKNFLQAFKSVTESLSFHIIKYQNPWMYRTLHCYLIGYVWFIWCACISHQGSSIIYAWKGRGTGDFEGGRIFWTPPGGLWLFRPPQGRAGIFSTPPQRGLDFFRPPLLNFFSKKNAQKYLFCTLWGL